MQGTTNGSCRGSSAELLIWAKCKIQGKETVVFVGHWCIRELIGKHGSLEPIEAEFGFLVIMSSGVDIAHVVVETAKQKYQVFVKAVVLKNILNRREWEVVEAHGFPELPIFLVLHSKLLANIPQVVGCNVGSWKQMKNRKIVRILSTLEDRLPR